MAKSYFGIVDALKHKASIENLIPTEIASNKTSPFALVQRLTTSVIRSLGWPSKGVGTDAFEFPSLTGDNGPLANALKNVPGFDRAFTLSEYEKKIGSAPNLGENLNPLGLELNLTELFKPDANDEIDYDFLRSRANNLRSSLARLNSISFDRFEKITNGFAATQSLIDASDRPNHLKILRAMTGYIDDGSSIVGNTVDEQLVSLRNAFFQGKKQLIETPGYHNITHADEAISSMNEVISTADAVRGNYSDIAPYMTDRVRDYHATNASFPANLERGLEGVSKTAVEKRQYESVEARNRATKNLRPSYVASGHSSYPKLATDYGNKGESERDMVERTDEQIRTDMEQASPAFGHGDKIQADSSVETVLASIDGPIGPLDPANWDKYKTVLGERESNNDWTAENDIGFLGRWQFGNYALIDYGYVKPGTATRNLKNPNVWTGKDGINNREDFKNNREVQSRLMAQYTLRNYKSLLRSNTVTKTDTPDVVAGYLAVAHLLGPGGARKLKAGQDKTDAYGTSGSKYLAMMKESISGDVPQNETTQVAESLGATSEQQMAAYVGSTTVPDAPVVVIPASDTSSSRYPYNAVTTYEGGHFKEYDSTPGAERIQERHRTGTGYEVGSDGQFKHVVVSDSYRAVMGSDYIIVHGHCQIVVAGDIGLSATGNVNINAGQDLNFLVGGDMNVHVAGDKAERIDGSSIQSVSGDASMSVEGFMKVSADGDYQVDGASANVIARDGDVNIAASESVSVIGIKSATILGKAKTTITSAGDVVTSAGGAIASAGASIAMKAAGFFGVKSTKFGVDTGYASIKAGDTIQVSPRVSHADWSDQSAKAGVAPNGAAVVVMPPQIAEGVTYSHDAENSNRQSMVKAAEFDKTVQEFEAIDSSQTKSHSSGINTGDWDGHGYRSGVVNI